jgi:hypothetical protein
MCCCECTQILYIKGSVELYGEKWFPMPYRHTHWNLEC